MKIPNQFELALSASGMTKTKAQEKLGFKSYVALMDRIENPALFRLGEIEKLNSSLNVDGKEILKKAVLDIFLS